MNARPHRIRCAHCSEGHSTVAEVLDCHYRAEEDAANAMAEYLAEQAVERYFEEGPESFQAVRFAEEQADMERTLYTDPIWGMGVNQ